MRSAPCVADRLTLHVASCKALLSHCARPSIHLPGCREAAEQVREVQALHEADLRTPNAPILPHLRGGPESAPGRRHQALSGLGLPPGWI